ncbi:MAG: hypothetical protein ABH861_01725 [Patescibacteria group bacterium]|nr:hypothetical protein [Patescibacteria group bacterium]
MSEALSYLASINWSTSGFDLFIFLLFAISAALYGLLLKREQITLLMIMMYVAFGVVTNIPYLNWLRDRLTEASSSLLMPLAFLLVFGILFYVFMRNRLWSAAGRRLSAGAWWFAIIYSVLPAGLLISIILNLLPLNVMQNINGLTRLVFLSSEGRTVWILAPILFMTFLSYIRRSSSYDD